MTTAGQPRKFDSPEEITKLAEKYFKKCDEREVPYTINGLAFALNTTRETISAYRNGEYDTETVKYSDAMKRAKLQIVVYAEEKIYKSTAGAVAHLVNLTRNEEEPFINAQRFEQTGPGGKGLTITLLPGDETA